VLVLRGLEAFRPARLVDSRASAPVLADEWLERIGWQGPDDNSVTEIDHDDALGMPTSAGL
jgi:hypothetical protein